jgi:hypothetical protein
MQLNEILEEHTIKAISEKTNISESNIDALVSSDFQKMNRVQAMGFLSIMEREYHADLSELRTEATEYYKGTRKDESITLGLPQAPEKKGKSKFFMFIIFIMIGFAVWYAFINFDKVKLSSILPFSEEELSKMIMPGKLKSDTEIAEDLTLEHRRAMNEKNNSN